jgi:NAD-dependent dihydropyrimidine dehydrogenase PreA subunit
MQDTRITICACASRTFIHREKAAEVAAALKGAGYHVVLEADLCKKAMKLPTEMPEIAEGVVLACHSRALLSLMDWLELEAKQVEDIRNGSTDEALARFGLSYSVTENFTEKEAFLKQIEAFPVESGTDAWYPVLDKKRCTDCGRCHDFCLFGVYAVENKRVRVAQPQSCKNSCPACARVCLSSAIIFPKYEKSPINGGTAQEEIFSPEEMDKMYRDRLRMRLQQRRAGVSLLKKNSE